MNEWQIILIVVLVSVLGAFASLFQKLGSRFIILDAKKPGNTIRSFLNSRILIAIAIYIVATSLFVLVLQYGRVSVLYPLTSLTYIWIVILSILLLKERMNIYKWSGILLVMTGIVFISM